MQSNNDKKLQNAAKFTVQGKTKPLEKKDKKGTNKIEDEAGMGQNTTGLFSRKNSRANLAKAETVRLLSFPSSQSVHEVLRSEPEEKPKGEVRRYFTEEDSQGEGKGEEELPVKEMAVVKAMSKVEAMRASAQVMMIEGQAIMIKGQAMMIEAQAMMTQAQAMMTQAQAMKAEARAMVNLAETTKVKAEQLVKDKTDETVKMMREFETSMAEAQKQMSEMACQIAELSKKADERRKRFEEQ